MAEMKAYDVYERNQTNVINEDGQLFNPKLGHLHVTMFFCLAGVN